MGTIDIDVYIRVSRVGKRRGASFISPDVQRERCEGVAKAGGHRIVATHTDLDESGGKADRPGFLEALRRVESGETGGIVVAKLDRFARSVADAAQAIKRIEAAGGALMVADSSLDTSTSFGRFAMHMMLAMAELELDRYRENWDTARENAVARGIHIASRTPTGYERDEEKRLLPSGDAAAVTELFKRRAKGASWGELATVMESAGVETPYGSAFWTAGSLAGVLANRVYLGEARSGEHVEVDAHRPLTDEATWRQAQRAKQRAAESKGGMLLSGVLRCAGCRYVMKADRTTDRSGEVLPMYRCRGKKAAGECPAPSSVLARLIEPWVVERFLDQAGDQRLKAAEVTADLSEAQADVERARAQVESFLEADIAGTVGVERFRAELERRNEILQAAERHLAELVDRAGGVELPSSAELRKVWTGLERFEQRHLLSLGLDAIFLRRAPRQGLSDIDNRVLMVWRGEGPDDLPGRGRRPPMRSVDW